MGWKNLFVIVILVRVTGLGHRLGWWHPIDSFDDCRVGDLVGREVRVLRCVFLE